jgi:glycerol-3-phosphate dehydrogenase
LVRHSLIERGLLHRNAPHVVHRMTFILPVFRWWERPFYGLGLKCYDAMAGSLGLGPSRFLNRSQTLERLPTLAPAGLRGGIQYFDGQFDDARLAVRLAQTIHDQGGTALNYVEALDLIKENGRVAGASCRDVESGRVYPVRAKTVINATGIFADALRRRDQAGAAPMLTVSQGAHLVLDRSFLPGDTAMMIPRTDDGRILFAIPWLGRVLVGTTDTPRTEPVPEPKPLEEEIQFLLEHAGRYLNAKPARNEVRSVFAGLRPLVRSAGGDGRPTAQLSRDHPILVSGSGLITVAGGKWTTYRQMAEETVDRAVAVGALKARACATKSLRIHGWTAAPAEDRWQSYGADAPAVSALGIESWHERLAVGQAEVRWAVRQEMARTLEDVLARRTRGLFLDARASLEIAPRAAACLAEELRRDATWADAQLKAFQSLAARYL